MTFLLNFTRVFQRFLSAAKQVRFFLLKSDLMWLFCRCCSVSNLVQPLSKQQLLSCTENCVLKQLIRSLKFIEGDIISFSRSNARERCYECKQNCNNTKKRVAKNVKEQLKINCSLTFSKAL